LRIDAGGAIRAARGILHSSYRTAYTAQACERAGDNSAALAVLKQATTLVKN
jgi:type VI secretion system secreted protein VgrG